MESNKMICPTCNGTGKSWGESCDDCNGTGRRVITKSNYFTNTKHAAFSNSKNECPSCNGTGKSWGEDCDECNGTGLKR